jgi:hypothetical protein
MILKPQSMTYGQKQAGIQKARIEQDQKTKSRPTKGPDTGLSETLK